MLSNAVIPKIYAVGVEVIWYTSPINAVLKFGLWLHTIYFDQEKKTRTLIKIYQKNMKWQTTI